MRSDGRTAWIAFADGDYRLDRKPSSIGERFTSPAATLIIDDESAVFVSQDRLGLRGCTAVEAMALPIMARS